jgi:hypothetical protein
MKTALTIVAVALGLATQANAGVLCSFDTPDRQGFSLGYVEGSGQAPDFLKGMYRQYGFSRNGQVSKWDAKTGGPAWAYTIANGVWSFTSVDDASRLIAFDQKARVPNSAAVDFAAVLHDAGHDYPGVCEIGGAI